MVHHIHGAGDQGESTQSSWSGVLVLRDGERSARCTGLRHRIRYDGMLVTKILLVTEINGVDDLLLWIDGKLAGGSPESDGKQYAPLYNTCETNEL